MTPYRMKGYTSDSYGVQIAKLLGWVALVVLVGTIGFTVVHFVVKYW